MSTRLSAGLLFALCLSCTDLRRAPECTGSVGDSVSCEGLTAGKRMDAGSAGFRERDGGSGTDAQTSTPPGSDPECPAGLHACGGACVDNQDPKNCASSCDPCPTITGGTPTCDGSKCGVTCPAGTKSCPAAGACIAIEEPCAGNCPAGKNLCNGVCTLPTEKTACGPSCMPCPVPANSTARCASGICDFDCTAGTKCNGQCVTAENCTNGVDDDCDGEVDCADSQCGNGTNCGGGNVCRERMCVVPCNEGAACTDNPDKCFSGRISCGAGGACVNGSPKVCGANQTCRSGACVDNCSAQNGNPCETNTCSPGRFDCSNNCVNRQARTCPTDQVCSGAGVCGCPGGTHPSNGHCCPDGQEYTNGACRTPCVNVSCLIDVDRDGYGDERAGRTTSCGSCPAGRVPDRGAGNNDCFDSGEFPANAAKAYPGAPFPDVEEGQNRGDGSYDFNCDGQITYQIPLDTCNPVTCQFTNTPVTRCESATCPLCFQNIRMKSCRFADDGTTCEESFGGDPFFQRCR